MISILFSAELQATLQQSLATEALCPVRPAEMRHPNGVLTFLFGLPLFVTLSEAFLGPAVLPSCSRYVMMFFVFSGNMILFVECTRNTRRLLHRVTFPFRSREL